uniref:PPK2 family polyphosphate kinase n=1 Tax=Agrococcus chionoecetis TaxID=3153752 RepID=UPI003F4F40A0
MTEITDALRITRSVQLAEVDPRSTPGFDGKKADGREALEAGADRLADLQERLFAASKEGGERSVLLMVQGMDTSGKGGIMRHVVGLIDPQGVDITAFKAPTAAERKHDFLWRIERALPKPGSIGVFDRSHYEDVLIHRVHELSPAEEIQERYGKIVEFEREIAARGIRLVKVMLHISFEEQGARLLERLDRPDKHWKYNPGDVDEREHWDAYMEAYQVAINRTARADAPWHVVPADRKWYARLAVRELLLEALEDVDPQWPLADYDVAAERERLLALGGVPTPEEESSERAEKPKKKSKKAKKKAKQAMEKAEKAEKAEKKADTQAARDE